MEPSVSINLCCYNSEKYIRETLDSIICQTYKDWQLIIINDGSKDSTESIVNEYINQGLPIVYHYQENKGLGYSRNTALKHSQGEYIAFIDHDDLLHEDSIKERVELLNNNQDASFVFTNARFLKNGKKLGLFHYGARSFKPKISLKEFIHFPNIALSSVMIRSQTLSQMQEWFDVKLSLVEDLDLWIRLADGHKICFIDKDLSYWRLHETNSTKVSYAGFSRELAYLQNKYKDKYPGLGFVLDILLNMQIKHEITHELMNGSRVKAFNKVLFLDKSSIKFLYYLILCFLPTKSYIFIQKFRGRF